MRAAPWGGVTAPAVRLARVMRGMAGGAFPVSLQRHLSGVAVLAGQAGARDDVDIVPERDVTHARGVGDLEGQRQPDGSLDRDVVGAMALRAGQCPGRVVMTRRAIAWRAHPRRAMHGAGAVTAATGQFLVALMGKAPPDQRVTRELRPGVRT